MATKVMQEINIEFEYKNEKINAVLHTDFNLSNPYITIIVPGIFGDRGDSRSMFTSISRAMNSKGFSTLRFDFYGGGSNFGDYSKNNFESFIDQLHEVTSQLLRAFGFMRKVIYIGFSEGLKFAFYSALKRDDVVAILSCNGLCVEEKYLEKINRPKIKEDRMIYDSDFGTWISWDIVEKYKQYFIDSHSLNSSVDFFGVYSTADILSENSRIFWQKQGWPLKLITGADHLYTRSKWVEELIKYIIQWHYDKIGMVLLKKDEYFLRIGSNKVCLKLVEQQQVEDYVIFIHGLFQNKSGPGFLFTQIADKLRGSHSICMFDLFSAGDSDGHAEDLTYDDMLKILSSVLEYLKARNSKAKIIGVASGSGNYLLYEKNSLFDRSIMLFPNTSNFWNKLSCGERQKEVIDISDIYDEHNWAEKECCILGNIKNRSKGMLISTSLLKRLSEFNIFKMLNTYKGYSFVNQKKYYGGERTMFINDNQGLLMSSKIRDKAISDIVKIIEKPIVKEKKSRNDKRNYTSL